ncbi:MAG: ABC transporter permease [Candidatus Zixiibacteriota bacterium]
MGKVFTLAGKDLRVLFRDKGTMFWVLGFPLLIALFFGFIFSGGSGPSKMKIAIIDKDESAYSQAYAKELGDLSALESYQLPADSALDRVRRGKLSAVITIREGFGRTHGMFTDSAMIEVGVDPSKTMTAGYLQGLLTQTHFKLLQKQYADPDKWRADMDTLMADSGLWAGAPANVQTLGKSIITDLRELSYEYLPEAESIANDSTGAAAKQNDGFNLFPIKMTAVTNDETGPRSSFEITFPSSILWALIGIASSFAVSIVKERTAGTFLRLRLAPISRMHILAGKGLACFISCFTVSVLLMLFGAFVFKVRIGDPVLLAIAMACTAFCFVGIAMLVSTIGKTEESVGGAAWGILLVCAMTGGGMLPLMFMPGWLVAISNFSPVKWGILAIEGAVWRGFTYTDMLIPVGMLIGIGILTFSLGVSILSKRDA